MFKELIERVKEKYNHYVREYQVREENKKFLKEIADNSRFKPGEAEALEKSARLRFENNLREQREAERIDSQNFFDPERNLREANETLKRIQDEFGSKPNPEEGKELEKPAKVANYDAVPKPSASSESNDHKYKPSI